MTFTFTNANGEQVNFGFDGRESFLDMVASMYDAIELKSKEGLKTEEEFWNDFLLDTPFETKKDFDRWMGIMDDNGLLSPNLNFDVFKQDIIEEELGCTEYDSIDEMLDKIAELESKLDDIHQISEY